MKRKHHKQLDDSPAESFDKADLYLRFKSSPSMQALSNHHKRIFEQSFAEDDLDILKKLAKLLDDESEVQGYIADLQQTFIEECINTLLTVEKRRKTIDNIQDLERIDQEKALKKLKQIIN